MRIFVYEHVTGGGMAARTLPPGLLHEADLMVRTLLADLATCPDVELRSTRDARLPEVPGADTLVIGEADDLREALISEIESADAVWPIAPETGAALEAVSVEILRRGRTLLGSRPDAVRIAASKRETVRVLAAAGVPSVPTWSAGEPLPQSPGRWITKPDDGAGAEATRLAADWRDAARQLVTAPSRYVAQPWLDGIPISLSLLCAHGRAELICGNRQRVRIEDAAVVLGGIEVNAVPDPGGELAALGTRVAAAIPGLWGYVGVDLILTPTGPVVLEVNPRLTTSYCGIGQALGVSVASAVLDLQRTGVLRGRRVSDAGSVTELRLEAYRHG